MAELTYGGMLTPAVVWDIFFSLPRSRGTYSILDAKRLSLAAFISPEIDRELSNFHSGVDSVHFGDKTPDDLNDFSSLLHLRIMTGALDQL